MLKLDLHCILFFRLYNSEYTSMKKLKETFTWNKYFSSMFFNKNSFIIF